MNRGGGFVRSTVGIAFEQLSQASFVKIANRTCAVRLDPVGMLDTKVVVNLKLERREAVVRLRPGN